MGKVARHDGLYKKGAKARAAKDDLDQHCPFEKESEFQPKEGDDRDGGMRGDVVSRKRPFSDPAPLDRW